MFASTICGNAMSQFVPLLRVRPRFLVAIPLLHIVVGLPSDSRRAKSHFVHCPLKIDLSLRRVRNILAPGRAHELGTGLQAGYCGGERAKSLLWAIFGPLAVFSAIFPPRMRSLRSIRVLLVTVLSGPVCLEGFRKAQMLLLYARCVCVCVCACECICVCVFEHPSVCMMGASECVVCVPSCRLTLSHSVELPRESFRGHIPASLKRNYPAI